MCICEDHNIPSPARGNKSNSNTSISSTSNSTTSDNSDNSNVSPSSQKVILKNELNMGQQTPQTQVQGQLQRDQPSQQQKHHHHHHHHAPDMTLCEDYESYDDIKRPHYTIKDACQGSHTTALGKTAYILIGVVASCLSTLFSVYFPFWLAPAAAAKTYFLAFYHYDADKHHFDNTVWTYGTDYGLCVAMLYQCYRLHKQHQNNQDCPSHVLCTRIYGLFLGYAASVLAGAIAHQHYTTTEDRNTWHFRLLWTICVGTVTLASQSMGSIGSEMAVQLQPHTVNQLPFIPDVFWTAYGIFTTLVCAIGWFSYQRPACDIFIAGITQFPSSFYVIVVLWKQDSPYIHPMYQLMGMSSFILNAPLLPMYPLLVQYTDLSLASVNTLLHCWLFVSWSMQAISMIHVRRAVVQSQHKPHGAIPRMMDHHLNHANNNIIKKEM